VQDSPIVVLEVHVANGISIEHGAHRMDVVPVIFDREFGGGIGEVELDSSVAKPYSVLLLGTWKTRCDEPSHELGFRVTIAGIETGKSCFEDRAHDGAAPTPSMRELEEDLLEQSQGCESSSQGVVGSLLDTPWRSDGREVAECARGRRDRKVIEAHRVKPASDLRVVHDHGR